MTAIHTDSRAVDLVSTPRTAARRAEEKEHREGVSKKARWAGRAASAVALLFLTFDLTMKLLALEPAVKGTVELGYPGHVVQTLGAIQLVCALLYALPRTAVLGAILWTGYLGGAVATHVRLEHALFTHTLFPIYVGVLLWLGLWLRDPALRRLLPLR